MLNHARLDRRYCFPAASHYPDRCRRYKFYWLGGWCAGIALGPVCIRRVVATTATWTVHEAGRSTASSNHCFMIASLNHCFMIASFRERLGSKLTAHRHHGRAPAASWFQVDTSERPFVMAQTLPWLQRCFGGSFGVLRVLKLILFQSKSSSNAQRLSSRRFKMQYRKQNRLHNPPAQYSIYIIYIY